MRRFIFFVAILFFLVSCSGVEENIKPNASIADAVTILNSVTTDAELSIKLSGKASTKDILLLKEALMNLEFRSIGKGFLNIDMTGISGVTELDPQYFGYLSMLKSVKLPFSLTSIPKYMFIGCKYLKSVTVEQNVNYVGYEAFYDCESLEELYFNSKSIEVRGYAFCGVNPEIRLENVQDAVMYFLAAPGFGKSQLGSFIKYLPTDNVIHVSKTFPIEEKGEEKTFNLSIWYTGDDDCLYLNFKDDDNPSDTKKIIALLKNDDVIIGSDVDGILADAVFDSNQNIEIPDPADGSEWYWTRRTDVFYSWDISRAYSLSDVESFPATIDKYDSEGFYYFKVKGESK